MGNRTLTNNFGLAYVVETALGVADITGWRTLEPNSLGSFGADITTVPRDPISRNRQREKGTITDLDSSVDFESDLTLSSFANFIECFAFATAVNGDMVFTPTSVTGTEYVVPTIIQAQIDKLQFTSAGPIALVFARGFVNPANNGLKPLTADGTANAIPVAGLVAETPVADNVEVEYCGIQGVTGDLALVVTGGSPDTATLTSTAQPSDIPIDFTTLGLTPGQFIHVGGLDPSSQFDGGTIFGFARVTSIVADVLTLDKLDSTLASDNGAEEAIQLLFGRFIRNVPVDDPDFLERSVQFEAVYTDLDDGPADVFEYAIGNFCNTMAISLPLTDKALISFGFIGIDTEVPTAARKTGADSAVDPNKITAFNTSSDIARLRITEIDETGLSTDFKSLTLTLNNNVSPEKVLATLGAKFMNAGNINVDIESQLLFTEKDVVAAIRDNRTLTMDFLLKNGDGAIYADIPSMTLGGGGKEFPVNESILINTTGLAFKDDILNTSFGFSLFAVIP